MRLHAIPGALLLILAGSQYGEAALAAVTGWPVDWCYALLQAAGQAALWAVVAAWAPLHLRIPAWAVCAWGAWEAAQRVACYSAWLLWPRPVAHDMTLCEAYTGLDLYRWTLVGLCVLGALIGGWASRAGGR